MKKMVVLVVVLLLLVTMMQVAFADPPGPVPNSCHMAASWWPPNEGEDTGPGNAYGVQDGQRGMYHVHSKSNPNGYTHGAANMDIICP